MTKEARPGGCEAAGWREVLGSSPGLASLLAADALATLHELACIVIIPWWVTTQGGVDAVAAYGVTLALATLGLAPAVSPLGDRYCKAMQMRLGLVTTTALTLALAATAAGTFALASVLGLLTARVLAKAFVEPAQSAMLPELVPAWQLPRAIRWQKACRALCGVMGPLVAAALLAATSVTAALVACALLSLAAAAAAMSVPRHPGTGRRFGLAAWWRDLRDGARAKWAIPMERGWTLVNFVVWIFQGPAVGLLIPIKVQALALDGTWAGIGLGALSLGALVGNVGGSQGLVRRFGRYRVRVGLGCAEGLCLVGVGLSPNAATLAVGLALAGFCNAAMALVGATHRALAIPRAYRVRMLAAGTFSTQIAGAIGASLVGLALTRWNVTAVYPAFGLAMAASVLGFRHVPRFQEFLTLDHTQVADWYAREYPACFVEAQA